LLGGDSERNRGPRAISPSPSALKVLVGHIVYRCTPSLSALKGITVKRAVGSDEDLKRSWRFCVAYVGP
jgi:hypothetical protein